MKIYDLIVYTTLVSTFGLVANNLNTPSVSYAKNKDLRDVRSAYIAPNVRAVDFPIPSVDNEDHTMVVYRELGTYDFHCNYVGRDLASANIILKNEVLGPEPKAFEEPPRPLKMECDEAFSKLENLLKLKVITSE